MAIRGTQKEKFLSADDILERTTGGYDIYMFYLGKVARIMQRPWGHKEKKLSWGIFPYNGIWMWKDQANEEAGTAIQFVEKLFGLSFQDACNRIAWDFQLRPDAPMVIGERSSIVNWDEPTEEEKKYVRISFTSQPFQKHHHEFWAGTDVTEAHCNRYECWAVKDLAIKGKRFKFRDNEVIFAYYCPEEDGAKIYFPERGYDEFNPKFRTNVSGNHLWNYDKLMENCGGGCEKGIIQKSHKDALITTLFTENVIWPQSEKSKLFLSPHTIEKVGKLFTNVWMAFGSDPDGVAKSQKITEVTKWNWVNPDKRLLPEVDDFFSLAKKSGPKAVEDLLKYKKFL